MDRKGPADLEIDRGVIKKQEPLSRLHCDLGGWASWHVMQRKTTKHSTLPSSINCLADADDQVVGAAARIAPDLSYKDSGAIAELLKHSNLRVRYRAAMSLAKIGKDADVPKLVEMLVENADKDPILRHGGDHGS